VLVVRPIGQGQTPYYLHGPLPGAWWGAGASQLGLSEAVDGPALRAVLGARHPDGSALRPTGPRHRGGFDLIFAAPKSVSLLAFAPELRALPGDGGPPGPLPVLQEIRRAVLDAHEAAVRDALAYLERRAVVARAGARRSLPTSGAVAALFRHHRSWAGDPHLHSHVVVANAAATPDGCWHPLDSWALYQHRRAAGALYDASLRHQLAVAGWQLTWTAERLGGRDLEAVPRAAIDTCSTSAARILALRAISPGPAASTGRRSRGVHRARPVPDGPDWAIRAARAGLDRGTVAGLLVAAKDPSVAPPLDLAGLDPDTVAAHLDRRSTFARRDCLEAIAGLLPHGAPAAAIEGWTDRFVERCAPAGDHRWVTTATGERSRAVVAIAVGGWRGSAPAPADARRAAVHARGDLAPETVAAIRALTRGGPGLVRLGAGPLLAQATVLDAAREAWEAGGHRVVLVASSPEAEQRWQALAGLQPASGRGHGTVTVVDRADLVATTELHRLTMDVSARGATLVLVEGGSGPARAHPPSPAYRMLQRTVRVLDPGPLPVVAAHAPPVRGGRGGTVAVSPTMPAALSCLLGDWAGAPGPAVMVAQGAQEAAELNRMAHRLLATSGRLGDAAVMAGDHEWRAGDLLRVLRRDPRLDGGRCPAGTIAAVQAVDPSGGTVTIAWPGGTAPLRAARLAHAPVTYGYACTLRALPAGGASPLSPSATCAQPPAIAAPSSSR